MIVSLDRLTAQVAHHGTARTDQLVAALGFDQWLFAFVAVADHSRGHLLFPESKPSMHRGLRSKVLKELTLHDGREYRPPFPLPCMAYPESVRFIAHKPGLQDLHPGEP